MIEKLYGIIGHPLGHSLSPLLHGTAFKILGLPSAYMSWPVAPKDLPAFMEAFRLLNIQGASVTIPHKETVIPFLDALDERAEAVGAVNLIYRRDGLIRGDNTDVLGFMEPLKKPAAAGELRRVLVLGAGGAARAVVAALKAPGLRELAVAYNSKAFPEKFAADCGFKQIPWAERLSFPADLVVNATPLGMKGAHLDETPYPAEAFAGRRGLAYDLIYAPPETRFLREAAQAGWRTAGGVEMFLGQAEAQFFAWTGHELPNEAKEKVRSLFIG